MKINHSFLKTYIFPLLLFVSLFCEINFINIEGGVPVRVSLGDFAIGVLIFSYILFYRETLLVLIRQEKKLLSMGLLFILISTVTGISGNDLWLISLKCIIKIYTLFVFLIFILYDSDIKKNTLVAFCIFIIVIDMIGVMEFYASDFFQSFLLIFKSPDSLSNSGYTRVSSVFVNTNPFGVFNSLSLITIFYLRLYKKIILNKYLFYITIALCIKALYLTASLNAFLTLFTGILIFLFYKLKIKKITPVKIMIWSIISIIITSYVLFVSIKYNRTICDMIGRRGFDVAYRIYNKNQINLIDFVPHSLRGRLAYWEYGIEKLKDNPMFGIGADQFAYPPGSKSGEPNIYKSHNFIGEFLFNHGTTGLLFLIIIIGAWLKRTETFWQRGLVLTFFASQFFDFFLTYEIIWLIFTAWLVTLTTRPPEKIAAE